MLIRNGSVLLPDGTLAESDLLLDGDRIGAVVPRGAAGEGAAQGADGQVVDASGCVVAPGLIDLHCHAAMGHDFSRGTEQDIQAMADFELSQGVTAFCPTSMTFPEDVLARSMRAAAAHANERGARVVGVNMEGPFISYERRGAQNPDYIQRPDAALVERLQQEAGGLIRLVDVAPEVPGALELISQVTPDIRVSLAHTACTYEQAQAAFDAGARELTHIYNAMPPFAHRAPGPIGAAFDDGRVSVELIADGIHVHPSVVRATFALFDAGRVILISDSMEATGLADGSYELGGQRVLVRGRRATLEDGTIAGSVTSLLGCVRCCVREMGIPVADALVAATASPARALGISEERGLLAPGRVADVVVLDQGMGLVHIVQAGRLVL